eukprot:m.141334 g.141334  ORF g.141334 m.141334 type:complete len:315 (+) comp14845_c0_seq2:82-1026(+)
MTRRLDDVVRDTFGGITIKLAHEGPSGWDREEAHEFSRALTEKLETWKEEKVTAVWLHFPKELIHFARAAIDLQFELHYAANETLVLSLWLGKGASRLPQFAHHLCAAAGMVLAQDPVDKVVKILCIRERHGPTAKLKDFWKLPGGSVDQGEEISAAAVREVMEETKINTQFERIVAVREMQNGLFGNTDLYFVCWMTISPKDCSNTGLPQPELDGIEIAEARWLPVEQLLKSPYYNPRGVYGALMQTSVRAALRMFEERLQSSGQLQQQSSTGEGLRMSRVKNPFGGMDQLFYTGADIRTYASNTRRKHNSKL